VEDTKIIIERSAKDRGLIIDRSEQLKNLSNKKTITEADLYREFRSMIGEYMALVFVEEIMKP